LKEILTLGRQVCHRPFWALRDVNFEVGRGETFGVIGDNGAGKSTLLKLLCGVTRPTEGALEVRGTLTALLDLGAGFHPDFTGRENLRLNAVLAGLTSREQAEKEEEIVAFAELREFIDRPIRTYSTGMVMRLGFALATCVNPDVLVVDEVLAVGDQHFQKKCVDRILGFREAGRTIVFCSHALYQVKQICDRAVWLKEGRVMALGRADAVVDAYTDDVRTREEQAGEQFRLSRAREQLARLTAVERDSPRDGEAYRTGEGLAVRVACEAVRPGVGVAVGVGIVRNDRLICYGVSTQMDGLSLQSGEGGRLALRLRFPSLPLQSGSYALTVYLLDEQGLVIYDCWEQTAPFLVRQEGKELGVVRMEHAWEVLERP
jgi:lipopolysaccharide transport system ATP-binding protein